MRQERDWPKSRQLQLLRWLPAAKKLDHRRFRSCAVVGSSPELLLYEDGAAIDSHEARMPSALRSSLKSTLALIRR